MSKHDEHIIEAIGRCQVVIRNGQVVEVGRPVIHDCPLARRFACPVEDMTPEAIKRNIEARIRTFGMCTPERQVLAGPDFVIFGASELLSSAVRRGDLDAAVIVSDGAGTIVATNPALIQGIGGRMSGLVKTSPIPEVIARIQENGGVVLDTATATIDQAAGVALARDLGHRRVAVTTADATEAATIREGFPEAFIVAVHTTGISREDAVALAGAADLITACASRHIRDVAAKKALLQAGTSIPVFAMTPAGKRIILGKVAETDQQILVQGARLPVDGAQSPTPLY
ncbi:methanogenesis marker 8 protein [Methanoculleus sp.]|uniref:methanogenesis marker 8 protein n=1 Tax=Methanoculleus sp. TaxID=90427 RepID=UPI00261D675F|nr:methanogenesis marker 8 protein [Methanoculleus sp.]MDI6867387.1 DUF2099 family protein [Methanoculleus sp.]